MRQPNAAPHKPAVERLQKSIEQDLPLYQENAHNRSGKHTLRSLVGSQRQIRKLVKSPESVSAELSADPFPVIVGISRDFVRSTVPAKGASRNLSLGADDMAEFRPFADEIPLAALPLIAVPFENIEQVSALFKAQGYSANEIVAMEDLIPESLLRDLPALQVQMVREGQVSSLARSEKVAQERFVKIRHIASKMIDGVRRKRQAMTPDYEAPFNESWSDIDAAWVSAKGINQAVLGEAMTSKALNEQRNTMSIGPNWGTGVENSAFGRSTTDSGKLRADIPNLQINGANLRVVDMNSITSRTESGEVNSTLFFNCRQPGTNASLRYAIETDGDGVPTNVTVARDGRSMQVAYRESNIEDLLHHVTASLHAQGTQIAA